MIIYEYLLYFIQNKSGHNFINKIPMDNFIWDIEIYVKLQVARLVHRTIWCLIPNLEKKHFRWCIFQLHNHFFQFWSLFIKTSSKYIKFLIVVWYLRPLQAQFLILSSRLSHFSVRILHSRLKRSDFFGPPCPWAIRAIKLINYDHEYRLNKQSDKESHGISYLT